MMMDADLLEGELAVRVRQLNRHCIYDTSTDNGVQVTSEPIQEDEGYSTVLGRYLHEIEAIYLSMASRAYSCQAGHW